MSNALQSALAEGAAELEIECGSVFALGPQVFTAWPVKAPEAIAGRLEGARDNVFHYEARRCASPTFKRGDVLLLKNGKRATVADVKPENPETGLFPFSIHPPLK